jgi:hypothetical protein
MKFGVREITDVSFKATADGQKFGNTIYSQYDPILFFDSAKTSTLESTVATVYAQGGRGNPRLLAWDGDKVVTFMFEDALISPATFTALSGADLINGEAQVINLHLTEKVTAVVGTASGYSASKITLTDLVGDPTDYANSSFVKVLKLDDQGDIVSLISLASATVSATSVSLTVDGIPKTILAVGDNVLVDFYVKQIGGSTMEITAEKFAGYFYIEANTLFRGTDGKDYPAQFTIPKAKVQSNFTFTMAPTGDPSTWTFNLDAFPARTRFSAKKKVMFTLDISDTSSDVI